MEKLKPLIKNILRENDYKEPDYQEFDIPRSSKSTSPRPISQIASEIAKDWKNVNFAAKPYLEAMFSLNSINDRYYMDTASSIILYFLSNASTWKGETAKRIKNELKTLLKTRKKMDEYTSASPEAAVQNFSDKISPIIKKQIEYLKAVLPYLEKRPSDYKVVKDMLDSLELEGIKPLTDWQLSAVSKMLSKVLKENINSMKKKEVYSSEFEFFPATERTAKQDLDNIVEKINKKLSNTSKITISSFEPEDPGVYSFRAVSEDKNSLYLLANAVGTDKETVDNRIKIIPLSESKMMLNEDLNEFIGKDVKFFFEHPDKEAINILFDENIAKHYNEKVGKLIKLAKNINNNYMESLWDVKFDDGTILKSVNGLLLSPIGEYSMPSMVQPELN